MRCPPPEVDDLYLEDVYIRFHTFMPGKENNRGWIQVFDRATRYPLWALQVYTIDYDVELEQDVQDIFMTRAELGPDGVTLWIDDEAGRRHKVNLRERRVVEQTLVPPGQGRTFCETVPVEEDWDSVEAAFERVAQKCQDWLSNAEPSSIFDTALSMPDSAFWPDFVGRQLRQNAQRHYGWQSENKLQQLAEFLTPECDEAKMLETWNQLIARDGHPALQLDQSAWQAYLPMARLLSEIGGETALEFPPGSDLFAKLCEEAESGLISTAAALSIRWDQMRVAAGYPVRARVDYRQLKLEFLDPFKSALQQGFL